MAEVTLEVGAAAVCRDGFPGELKALVLDPGTRVVTHLVIEPGRGHGAGRDWPGWSGWTRPTRRRTRFS